MYQLAQNISFFLSRLGFSNWQLLILAGLTFVFVVSLVAALKMSAIFIFSILEKKIRFGHFSLWIRIFEKLNNLIIVYNGFYFASLVLSLPNKAKVYLTVGYIFVQVVLTINITKVIIENSVRLYFQARGNVTDSAIKTVINFVKVFDTIVLWLVASVVFLKIINVDPQALVNGLGIASIIVAFSFQNVLRDIFAFFSLYLDRSFGVGDYVEFGDFSGTIVEIRLRTTRIRALVGNQLIVSNYELSNSVIENYNKMHYRRVSFALCIRPNVQPDVLQHAVEEMRAIFARPEISERCDLLTVVVGDFTNYGLMLKVIYKFKYVAGEKNYYRHLDYKQQIELLFLKVLREAGLELVEFKVSA